MNNLNDQAPIVLCVDDDPDMLASVGRILRREGYQILQSNNPHEGLKILGARPVAVLVSDFEMPEMTGVELCVGARSVRPETVRILLTGRGTLDAALRAINDGEVHRFLTKPWEDDELREIVAGALARLEELRRAQAADQGAARKRAMVTELEREHPGIAQVDRDGDGAYVIDERRIAIVRSRVAPELSKLLD